MAGFDARAYGRALYALRKLRGFDKAEDLAAEVSKLGIPTKERTVWAIERGDQIAGVDRHLAFCRILRAKPDYFDEALADD
jgi:transcriptional regulator with XRE-family HTH domain